jgi:HK97 family phage major capsid protein
MSTLIDTLRTNRSAAIAAATALLHHAKAESRSALSPAEQVVLDGHLADVRRIDERLSQVTEDTTRTSGVPSALATLSATGKQTRALSTAGQLCPLAFTDEAMRAAFEKTRHGEVALLETRDFISAVSELPPQLYSPPTFPRHEDRLVDRLPGIQLDAPSLEYVQVNSVVGSAAIVGEGEVKPEVTMPPTKVITTALKLAVHGAISWENINDYDAFTAAVRSELLKQVVDLENHQVVYGDPAAGGLDGLLKAPGILTFAATGGGGPNPENFSDIAGAIATMRTGPALATPDLILLAPNTWANIRTQKDGYGRFLATPDPTDDQAETVWGIDVLQSTAFTAGEAVLIDSTLFGRIAVREALTLRLGFANDDFTRNLVRTVCEERLNVAVERPAAILHMTGLPTAAPSVAETKSTAKK